MGYPVDNPLSVAPVSIIVNTIANGLDAVPADVVIPVTIPEAPFMALNPVIFSIFKLGVSANIVGSTVYPTPGLVIVVPVTTPLVTDAVAVAVVVAIPTNCYGCLI
jgi:hypothetical protein